MPNSQLRQRASGKKQRFRSPLSDVVELFRLTLDTEEKKILLGQKRGIFYSAFLLITALCEIMKNAPIFYESLWLPMMLLAFARTGGCFHSIFNYSPTVRVSSIASSLIIYSLQSQQHNCRAHLNYRFNWMLLSYLLAKKRKIHTEKVIIAFRVAS